MKSSAPVATKLPTQRGLAMVFLLLAAAGATAHYFWGFSHDDLSGHAWGSDDAYVSYRYAANLAHGDGLVFNPGERVEGYTNFLYVLLATLFIKVIPQSVYAACFVFNLLMLLSTLLLFYWHLEHTHDRDRALAAFGLVCLSPIMWAWPASGLETSAVLLIQLSLFVCAERDSREPSPIRTALFCGLAGISLLLRADGFIFPLICSSAYVIRRRWSQAAAVVAVNIFFTALVVAARYQYYGLLLPNTYYAKASGPIGERMLSGVGELLSFGTRNGFLLYILPMALGWGPLLTALKKQKRIVLSVAPVIPTIGVALLCYWIYVGGDVFKERFLLVLIPLGVTHLFREATWRPTKRWVPTLVCLASLQLVPFVGDGRFDYQFRKYDRWVELGQYLSTNHRDATLAIDAAGKVSFFSRLHTLDMLGLNDRHIGRMPVVGSFGTGHNKYDADYVLARQPDLIAGWGDESLDMRWGLTRAKYLSRGYSLRYLVNTSSQSMPTNIMDVRSETSEAVAKWIERGYRYFVVMRERPPDK